MEKKDIDSIERARVELNSRLDNEIKRGENIVGLIKLAVNVVIYLIAFFIGRNMINYGNNTNGEAVIVMFVAVAIICFISFTGDRKR